jgi:hypothetical protein
MTDPEHARCVHHPQNQQHEDRNDGCHLDHGRASSPLSRRSPDHLRPVLSTQLKSHELISNNFACLGAVEAEERVSGRDWSRELFSRDGATEPMLSLEAEFIVTYRPQRYTSDNCKKDPLAMTWIDRLLLDINFLQIRLVYLRIDASN